MCKKIIIPLLIGGLIYIGFRSKSLLLFKWFSLLSLEELINLYRLNVKSIELPGFILYSLPDGLWSYSFLEFIGLFKVKLLVWMVVCLIISFEFLQLFSIIEGTFCFIDLTVNVAVVILYLKGDYKCLKNYY